MKKPPGAPTPNGYGSIHFLGSKHRTLNELRREIEKIKRNPQLLQQSGIR